MKGEGQYSTRKCILGFDFNGEDKTLWLEEEKRAVLLTVLKQWLRGSRRAHAGIPCKEFESVTAMLRHAFTTIPAGKGLLSPCNWVLRARPEAVFLHRNKGLEQAIRDARTLLRESTVAPTRCKELVVGWPDYIRVQDASGQGVGGVILGKTWHVRRQCSAMSGQNTSRRSLSWFETLEAQSQIQIWRWRDSYSLGW